MSFISKLPGFLEMSCFWLIFLFLGGFRLYVMAKLKIKTIMIISLIAFLVGEIVILYIIFRKS